MTNGSCKNYMNNWLIKRGFRIKKQCGCFYYFDNFSLNALVWKEPNNERYAIDIHVFIEELHNDEEREKWYKWADLSTNGLTNLGERNQWFQYLDHDEAYCERFLQDIYDTYIKPFFDKGMGQIKELVEYSGDFERAGYPDWQNHWHIHPKAKEYIAKLNFNLKP